MSVLSDKKVVLGLSGGVDSTAAALLLKEKNLEVIGCFFDTGCDDGTGRKKAENVADELGIKLVIKDVKEEFENIVISDFIKEYTHGRTPNPCIICNPLVKFKTIIDVANEENAKYIATGHYAQIAYSDIQKSYVIKTATNIKKDQSYMLYRLPEEVISRLILPLAEFDDKEKTRELTRSMHLSNSEAKDSQEICFIDENESYMDFLSKKGIDALEGNFIDDKGNVLGKHKGIINYTYGQRKGLGIAIGKPAFVTNIDYDNNTVTLGDNKDLFTNKVICEKGMFTATGNKKLPEFVVNRKLKAKIRYAAKPATCQVSYIDDNTFAVDFDEKQRAATPGQSLVIYMDDEVVGGGIIKE